MEDFSPNSSDLKRGAMTIKSRRTGSTRRYAVIAAVAILALVAIYAALGFWAVPRIVEKKLPPWLAQHYGVQLTLGTLHFNPFRFAMEAGQLVLSEADGVPVLQAQRLAVNFDPGALFWREWKFDRVALGGMQLDLVVAQDGDLNLVDLVHRLVPARTAPAADTLRIEVGKIEVSGSHVAFTDLRGKQPVKAVFGPLDLSMSDLSTLPGDKATYALNATLPGGASLQAQGELSLLPTLSATGHIAESGLNAAVMLPLLRNDLRIDRLQGRVALSADYSYAADQGLGLHNLELQASDIFLSTPGAQNPLIIMKKIGASGGDIRLAAHSLAFSKLAFAQGSASVSIGADGKVGWSELMMPSTSIAPSEAKQGTPKQDWRLAVAALQLDQVGLSYEDHQQRPPLVGSVGSLDAGMGLAVQVGSHFDVTAKDIALQARDLAVPASSAGGPGVMLDHAVVKGGMLDLGGRQVSAQDVSLEGGSAAAARNADGTIDWARRFSAPSPEASGDAPPAAPWRYDIARASVAGIDLALVDRSQEPAFDYGLRIESASAQHLANEGPAPVRFQAQIVAKLGGKLRVDGSVATNLTDLQSHVQLEQFALAPFAPIAKRYTGFDLAGGPLTLSADLRDSKGLSVDHLDVAVPGIVVRRTAVEKPLLTVGQLHVQGAQVAFAAQRVAIGQLTMAKGEARAQTGKDGQLDWRAVASGTSPELVPAGAAGAGKPWAVSVDSLALHQMAAHYVDLSRRDPLRLDVGEIEVSTALRISAGGGADQLTAQGLQAQLHDASLTVDNRKPAAGTLSSISLSGGRFDLAKQQVSASKMLVAGGSVQILRDARGHLPVLDSLAAATTHSPAATASRARAVKPWRYAIDSVQLKELTVDARDQTIQPVWKFGGQVEATVDHLASQGQASFDAVITLADAAGKFKVSGTATPATGDAQVHVNANSIALATLQPWVSRDTNLVLKSGRAGADVDVTYASGPSAVFKVSGQFDLDHPVFDQAGLGTHVLTLDRLEGHQLTYSHSDNRLSVGEIDLLHPETQIAIAKDRSVNLARWFKRADKAAPTAAAPASAAASAEAFDLAVQRVRVKNGSVDFSDESLILPFATKVTAIDATIVGVSNREGQRADVQATGGIQAYGSASVNGSVVPIDPRLFTDLHVKFNNVLVKPFSPYSATFAGRKVESGKIWLDLDYKIDHGDLLGKNDVRLANFTLGERVESPSAVDIPLNLAVSLLTDSKGEIHLSVPVRGDLDNPHFNVGDAIGHAFGNAISRIVTAPFRLIGKLFGAGDGASLVSIDFAPGSASLAPEEREKLDTLAVGLKQRPLLHLVVGAPYAEKADGLALKQTLTRQQLDARLHNGETGHSVVAFDDPATRRALRALLPQQDGNPGAGAVPPPTADRASYEALFKRIAESQTLGPSALPVLATRRAQAIAQYLTQQGIARARVQTGMVRTVAVTDSGTVDAPLGVSAEGSSP